MTDRLEIHVKGTPEPQPRPRARVIFVGGKPTATVYTPADADVNRWRRSVLIAAKMTTGYPADPWTGPVRVSIDAYFERPQRLCRARDPEGAIRKNSRPDADNLVKSILDALTPPRGPAEETEESKINNRRGYLWIDDGQVHLGPIDRWYVAKGCAPGVIIIAEKIMDESELFQG